MKRYMAAGIVLLLSLSTIATADWESTSFGGTVTVQSNEPTINSITPSNGSTDISITPRLYLNVTEPQGQTMTIYWSTNASDWTAITDAGTAGNYSQVAVFATSNLTTYYFYVNVTDSEGNWNNETYHFTTSEYEWTNWSNYWTMTQADTSINYPPVISDPSPANNSNAAYTITSWNCTIEDPNGDTFNWSIETAPHIGSNSANTENNGTKEATIGGLVNDTTYTVFVNVTDGNDTINETFSFTAINYTTTQLQITYRTYGTQFKEVSTVVVIFVVIASLLTIAAVMIIQVRKNKSKKEDDIW